ncbi:MAG: class I SAM-dependent methyltransferase [Candidatus Magasanikbacteria bacterium]
MSEIEESKTKGWGMKTSDGSEIWDTAPLFFGEEIEKKDWCKLIFYPKKFFLYRYVKKHVDGIFKRYAKIDGAEKYVPRILDVGCGTGSTVIDFKKMYGRRADVIGVDVVGIQIDLAKEKIKKHGVWAEVSLYNGSKLPFESNSFDAIYTSDVLGHVEDVQVWLHELYRVLKSGGVLAMFSESKLGKHAFLRNYLMKKGVNTDPHAEFHISLYSKTTLKEFLEQAGFSVKRMFSSIWAYGTVYPDEVYESLGGRNGFFFLKHTSRLFALLKKKTHPFSTAIGEVYTLAEMLTLGRFVESQGYVILAKKKIGK